MITTGNWPVIWIDSQRWNWDLHFLLRNVRTKKLFWLLTNVTENIQSHHNFWKFIKEGRPSTTHFRKWLLWMTSNRHIFSSLSILRLIFGHVSSGDLQLPSSLVITSIFGKSSDLNLKTPKIQLTFPTMGQKPKGRVNSGAKTDVRVSWDLRLLK